MFVTRQQKAMWVRLSEELIRDGMDATAAKIIANDHVNEVFMRLNPTRIGQSPARAAVFRAAATSISFMHQTGKMVDETVKGFANLAARKPVTPNQKMAMKAMLTLSGTVMGISMTSAAMNAAVRGEDVDKAIWEAINPDPRNGNFASLRFGVGDRQLRVALGGPYRSMFRAMWPDKDGIPFVGLGTYVSNRLNPAFRTAVDLIGNKDFYGKEIMTGNKLQAFGLAVAYGLQNVLPLSISTAVEGARNQEEPEKIAVETAGQFMGSNVNTVRPQSTLSIEWEKELKEYEDTPTLAAEANSKGMPSRHELRQDPELDAKLFVTGRVNSVLTPGAAFFAYDYIKKNRIDPDTIPGIEKAKELARKMDELGQNKEFTDTDLLLTLLEDSLQ
jgi:hypothetical protein